jgi:anti-sigma regulatory factor (Ser/Thr protein kinase)
MDPMPIWSYDVRMAAVPASASRARDFVTAHLLERGLWGLVDDVQLVVSELATNAMLHASSPFTVGLRMVEGVVTLTVRDESPAPPTTAAGDALDSSGRGMVIVEHVSRGWGVVVGDDGTKAVWASFVAHDAVPTS